jgi:hypothetical protein
MPKTAHKHVGNCILEEEPGRQIRWSDPNERNSEEELQENINVHYREIH